MARYIDADKLLDDLGLRKGITADEIINGIPEKGIRPMDAPHCWFFLSIILAPTADVVSRERYDRVMDNLKALLEDVQDE